VIQIGSENGIFLRATPLATGLYLLSSCSIVICESYAKEISPLFFFLIKKEKEKDKDKDKRYRTDLPASGP